MVSQVPVYWLARDGFEQARARLEAVLQAGGGSAAAAAIPAMEAAYWANVLNDMLRRNEPSYASLTGPGPELMLGLRCIRNRGTHQLPLTVRQTGGLTFPMTLPVALGPVTVHWVDLSALPPQEPRFVNAAADAAYTARFGGRLVAETLLEVGQWFSEEQARPGSPLAN